MIEISKTAHNLMAYTSGADLGILRWGVLGRNSSRGGVRVQVHGNFHILTSQPPPPPGSATVPAWRPIILCLIMPFRLCVTPFLLPSFRVTHSRRELAVWGVRVLLLEPGGYRTELVNPQRMTNDAHGTWRRVPKALKEQYGEEFHRDSE